MSELKIESTNGGSIAKVCGGQMIVDEKQNQCKIPPEASKEARTSREEEDYITIKLVPNKEIEQGQDR